MKPLDVYHRHGGAYEVLLRVGVTQPTAAGATDDRVYVATAIKVGRCFVATRTRVVTFRSVRDWTLVDDRRTISRVLDAVQPAIATARRRWGEV